MSISWSLGWMGDQMGPAREEVETQEEATHHWSPYLMLPFLAKRPTWHQMQRTLPRWK